MINLLPWRYQQKRARQQRILIGILLVGLLLLSVLILRDISLWRAAKKQRLMPIPKIDSAALQKMQQRIKTITMLRKKRSVAMHLFAALATLVPDKVHLDKVILKNGQVTIKGQSAEHSNIVRFVANINANPLLDKPVVAEVAQNKFTICCQIK